jgi:hypothetical protein
MPHTQGVCMAQVLHASTAGDTSSLDTVRMVSADDLDVAGMLTLFHQSTPHLLLIFESGEQQILGLASFFANLDQVFLLQN